MDGTLLPGTTASLQIARRHCRSVSDAPLFRLLANTVAVNADHHLAGLAAVSYRGDDLAGAYALGRVLLAGSAC
jgi:hypothetical protein